MTADPTLAVVRNEVDRDYEYHCDALAGHFEGGVEVDFPAGERPDLDGVVLSGSTAGVYEADDRPWIRDRLAADFDWTATEFSFADVNATRIFENFRSLVAERTVRA